MLFDPTTYRCNSRHYNLIAFHIDVGLLLRVLRAASSNNTDTLEVKLSQKQMPVPGPDDETENKPFLVFTGRGQTLNMLQELPISQPFSGDEIDRLVDQAAVTTLAPFYVDLLPCTPMLHAMVDRMKSVSTSISVAACKVRSKGNEQPLQLVRGSTLHACE